MTATIQNPATVTTCPASTMLDILCAAIKSASDDTSRPSLNGVLLVREARTLRAVSTDGHRLGMFGTTVDGPAAEPLLLRAVDVQSLISTIKQAVRTVGKKSISTVTVVLCAPTKIGASELVTFGVNVANHPTSTLTFRTMAEQFPPYEKVIPAYARSTDYLACTAPAIQSFSGRYIAEAFEACAAFKDVEVVSGASWRDPLVIRGGKGDFALVVVMPLVIAEQYRLQTEADKLEDDKPTNVIRLHG